MRFTWADYFAAVAECASEAGRISRRMKRRREAVEAAIPTSEPLAALAVAEGLVTEAANDLAEVKRLEAWQKGYVAQHKEMQAAGLELRHA